MICCEDSIKKKPHKNQKENKHNHELNIIKTSVKFPSKN